MNRVIVFGESCRLNRSDIFPSRRETGRSSEMVPSFSRLQLPCSKAVPSSRGKPSAINLGNLNLMTDFSSLAFTSSPTTASLFSTSPFLATFSLSTLLSTFAAMSDPFSVAGTAVGITSLGIQVCQGLARHYAQFTSFHHDISSTVGRVEQLERILEILSRHLQNLEEHGGVADEVLRSIVDCGAGLRRLDGLVKKFREVQMPVKPEDRVRIVRKRLLYPFKKDSLDELSRTVDRLQASLQLAIQTFQM